MLDKLLLFPAALSASIVNPYAREYGTTVFSFRNAKVDINKRIQMELKREINMH